MNKLITRRSDRGQAALYHARRRRNGLLDPSSVLFRTHSFSLSDTDIDTAAKFGSDASRSKPVTFAFTLAGDAAAEGLVFEFGSDARGLAVWVDGEDVGFAAGAGLVSSDDGATGVAEDALPDGQRFKFVLSVVPNTGLIELYREGGLIKSAQSASGNFGGGWSDDAAGAIGDLSGTVTDRVPIGSQAPLAGATLIGQVSVYLHQRAGQ